MAGIVVARDLEAGYPRTDIRIAGS